MKLACAPRPDSRRTAKHRMGRPAGRLRRLFLAFAAALLAACASPPAIPEGDAELALLPGNRAELLIDGPQAYAAMLAAIAGAERYIHLETYILEAQPRFDALLTAKRAQGVEVAVLYDGIGSISTSPDYFRHLEAAGVAVCEFNPANPLKAKAGWQLNNRDHRKLLVVDGVVAFTGGINISRVYTSSSFSRRRKKPPPEEGWRDTQVEVRGPVVADFQRLFLDSWGSQRCPPLAAKAVPEPTPAGNLAARLVAADPRLGRSELYVALLRAIATARQRVWLTYGYFVPDERMLRALEEAAARGVDVRLVLPGVSDFWAPFHAGRWHYEALLKAGVRIFERRDALLHAKTAVVDSVWASVGSTNFDWRSFVSNYEADLIVFDRSFAGRMEQLFRLDESTSHEIRPEEWRQRGMGDRIKEWLARWWERLL